jgi:hypothetical protein
VKIGNDFTHQKRTQTSSTFKGEEHNEKTKTNQMVEQEIIVFIHVARRITHLTTYSLSGDISIVSKICLTARWMTPGSFESPFIVYVFPEKRERVEINEGLENLIWSYIYSREPDSHIQTGTIMIE